jgi:tetratricopeptide (TPR) repeat protein
MNGRSCRRAPLAAGLLAVLLAAASCATVSPDVVARSAGEEEAAALDAFDLRLLAQRLHHDDVSLAALRSEIDRTAARPGLNRRLSARVTAQEADAALLAGDGAGARRLADAAAALTDAEAGAWLVRAELENDPARHLALIEQGLARADAKARLLCERGRALLRAGRYADAAQDLDEGLRGLDPRYRDLYGSDRQRAFSMAQAVHDSGTPLSVRPEDLPSRLTTRSMVELAAANTRFLSSLSPRTNPSFDDIRSALVAGKLLLDPTAAPEAPAPRKAVAYFLWGIAAREEHNPALLTRYRLKYPSSPVPDVSPRDPWFDSCLGTVEREIMDLPDGTNFRPDEPVTGIEYAAMLSRLKKLYK